MVSLPNFFARPGQSYGPEGLLEGLLQGYQASRMPAQMRNQEAMQRQELEKMLLSNQGERTKLPYLQPSLEQELQKGEQGLRRGEADLMYQNLINQFYPEQKQAEIEKMQLANEISRQTGIPLAQAQTALAQAQAQMAPIMRLTPQERDVAGMIGMENLRTPQGQKLLAALHRISPEDIGQASTNLPKGATSMAHWPQASVSKEIDRQNAELDKIQQIKVMKSGIEDAKHIMDAFPDMWKDFTLILSDPDNEGRVSRIIGALDNEEKRTAAIQFAKITSGIVNRSAETLGARGTNFRTKLLQKEKPSLFNTPEANYYIFDRLEEEFNPQLAREPELLAAHGKYALPRTFEHKKVESKHLAGANKNKIYVIKNNKTGETKRINYEQAKKMGIAK